MIDNEQLIKDLEELLNGQLDQKWYNDCIFYKHIMSTSKDEIKLDITETRLDIARDKTNSARESLDKYIYS